MGRRNDGVSGFIFACVEGEVTPESRPGTSFPGQIIPELG
jgi:hypothetical protein